MKQAIAAVISIAAMLGTAPQEALVHQLPCYDEVGTLTQYKNFSRGPFSLTAGQQYTLTVTWNEGGDITLTCMDQDNSYNTALTVTGGEPLEFTVPHDGFYHLKTPLDGSSITGLIFKLSQSEADGI